MTGAIEPAAYDDFAGLGRQRQFVSGLLTALALQEVGFRRSLRWNFGEAFDAGAFRRVGNRSGIQRQDFASSLGFRGRRRVRPVGQQSGCAIGRRRCGCRRAFQNEPGRLSQLGIFQRDRHFGQAHGRALDRAIEDTIRHALGPQGFVALFAQDPGDSVDDVGLAATVRADDAGRADTAEGHYRAFAEGLEPYNFDFSKLQQVIPFC